MPDTAVIDTALADLREMLASDDYLLNWHLVGEDRVAIEVAPGSDACADCLVPGPVMETIVRTALSSTPFELEGVRMPEPSGN